VLVRPKEPFISTALIPAGEMLSPSDILEDDHPHVRANRALFVPVRATIETATARPGEHRNVRRG
jgi:hypothetical protein